jgi:hypothetical protein
MGILSPTPNNWMLRQNMFLHKNDSMLLVIGDHTFFLFSGVAKIIHLKKRMENHTTLGLSTYKVCFPTIITHKK